MKDDGARYSRPCSCGNAPAASHVHYLGPLEQKPIVLFETEVGSQMWGMARPDSDHDYFRCYVTPTDGILDGSVEAGGAHFFHSETEDRQSHEVGRWVNELIRGNVNYMEGLFSPLVVSQRGDWLRDLKDLVFNHPSKAPFNSILGMANGNIHKYVANGKDPSLKRMNGVARTLQFGILYLRTGQISFDPPPDPEHMTLARLQDLRAELVLARDASPHPDHFVAAPLLRRMLLRIRALQWEGTL